MMATTTISKGGNMNNKLTALLTTAIVSGLIASQSAKAEDTANQKAGDEMSGEKTKCKGHMGKDKKTEDAKKQKKKDKGSSCAGSCGETQKDTKEK